MSNGHDPIAGAKPATCRHHWVIETPSGPLSRGSCRRCGLEREFRNAEPEPGADFGNVRLAGTRFNRRRR